MGQPQECPIEGVVACTKTWPFWAHSCPSTALRLAISSARSSTVALCLLSSVWCLALRSDQKLFMDWFGPRGLAIIVFAVIVLNANLPGRDTIAMTVVCTILLSVILHGLSANPLVAALEARL